MNDLFIITSVINTPDSPCTYTKTRSFFSKTERYLQTIETIDSIRKMIPNATLCLLECSSLDEIMTDNLKSKSDIFMNYYDKSDVKLYVNSIYKGAGESAQIFEYISNNDIKKYDNIFKICGRYRLKEDFCYKNFIGAYNIFHESGGSISTVFYKINSNYFNEYKENLKHTLDIYNQGKQYEVTMFNLFKNKYIHYPKINVCGRVGVDGTLWEA